MHIRAKPEPLIYARNKSGTVIVKPRVCSLLNIQSWCGCPAGHVISRAAVLALSESFAKNGDKQIPNSLVPKTATLPKEKLKIVASDRPKGDAGNLKGGGFSWSELGVLQH